jgi:hypothetical protein
MGSLHRIIGTEEKVVSYENERVRTRCGFSMWVGEHHNFRR